MLGGNKSQIGEIIRPWSVIYVSFLGFGHLCAMVSVEGKESPCAGDHVACRNGHRFGAGCAAMRFKGEESQMRAIVHA